MHPRMEETLEYLDSQRAALREAVELVPPTQRDQQPGPDRWSVAQVLDHLAMIEKRVTMLLSKRIAGARAAGIEPETETGSLLNSIPTPRIVDRTQRVSAPAEVRPESNMDAATAWAELEQCSAALQAAALTGDGLALSKVMHTHPILGEINLYQWMLFVGSHKARHVAQVREIAEQLKSSSTQATSASADYTEQKAVKQ